jgi:hypothetical protein
MSLLHGRAAYGCYRRETTFLCGGKDVSNVKATRRSECLNHQQQRKKAELEALPCLSSASKLTPFPRVPVFRFDGAAAAIRRAWCPSSQDSDRDVRKLLTFLPRAFLLWDRNLTDCFPLVTYLSWRAYIFCLPNSGASKNTRGTRKTGPQTELAKSRISVGEALSTCKSCKTRP